MSIVHTVISRQNYDKTVQLLRERFAALDDSGCFFALFATEYDERGNVRHDIFQLIARAVQLGYTYVNTIVYPTALPQQAAFTDNARYVLWLCKDIDRMEFHKDAIREKHIWKDVEWGRREKNYNPKGKDPGNVWIPTEDDGHAHITGHILLSDEEVIARLQAMSGDGDVEIVLDKLPRADLAPAPSPETPAVSAPVQGTVIFSSSESMNAVPDGSVGVAVTSPPYWDLKDYFKKGQIGQESYEDYLRRMEAVWRQCHAKLRSDGSLWVNINVRRRRGRVILIPLDFIKMCRSIGFFYKGIFLWHKSSGIPTGDKNIVDRHEYVLVFSKREDFSVPAGLQAGFRDYKHSAMNGGTFWNINRKAGSVGKKYIHPAIYPNELVRRIVLLTTAPGETVLDPFLGSGTSLIAALGCARSFVGYEFNDGFRELMDSRFERELPACSEIVYRYPRT